MRILKAIISLFVIAVSITLIDLSIEAVSTGHSLAAVMPLMLAIIGLVGVLCIALSCLLAPSAPSHNPTLGA